jgi:hypothetical protein
VDLPAARRGFPELFAFGDADDDDAGEGWA